MYQKIDVLPLCSVSWVVCSNFMKKTTALSIFLASAAALSGQLASVEPVHADQTPGGGLQEWSTDQDLDAAAKKDADAKAAAKKAAEQDICIPIGEGENCW